MIGKLTISLFYPSFTLFDIQEICHPQIKARADLSLANAKIEIVSGTWLHFLGNCSVA